MQAKSRNQDFLSVVQSVQSLLALPSRSALQLLAQHRWSLEALADQTFAACAPHGDCGEDDAGNESLPLQLAQAHQRSNLSGKSFQRLSDSFVDLFARQILVEKTTDGERTVSSVYLGNYEQASALCESCQEPACCGDLYALRCRHYCCISCWQGHIEDAVQAQAGHICCVRCTPSPVNETTSVLHPAGLDFITAVVPKETVQAYLLNQLR